MKWWSFKVAFAAVALLLPWRSMAVTLSDSIGDVARQWNKPISWRYNGWERIKPKNFKMQYAGGMGFLSFGAGWEYGKNSAWETDAFVGFLPKHYSDRLRFTFTLKQTYKPWSIPLGQQFSWEPFGCGLYVTSLSGDDMWKREPGKYPNNYYNFSTKMRLSVFLGQSFTFYPRSDMWRSVSLFYELGTNDLYVVTKATNRSVKMHDVLRLSFGIKLQVYAPQKSN